ncbi:MAG: pentapeptide repeat-containing protein [Gemmatimonadetes bacterium]|nr:pentapeptide repeat-containing protein [Gemmatimonadota bacterium]
MLDKLKSWLKMPGKLFATARERSQRLWRNLKATWFSRLLAVLFLVLIGVVWFCICVIVAQSGPNFEKIKNPDVSESIRNLILALGLLGGVLVAWLAHIRNEHFAKQVDAQTEQSRAQTEQAKLQRQQTRSETLSRCVEQMGNKESLIIRTAGIHGLEFLVQDNQNDAQLLEYVCGILQGFIDKHAPSRNPDILDKLSHIKDQPFVWNLQTALREARLPEKQVAELKEWDAHWQEHKSEVEQAIYVIGHIGAIEPAILRGPDLAVRYLPNLQVPKKRWDKPSRRGGRLFHSFLSNAHLENTDLRSTIFWKTGLKGADLTNAKMQKTIFCETKLEGANFDRAELAGAIYYETRDDYSQDIGNDPPKLGKPVTPEWLKEQGALNTDKAKFSDDSEN